jgi:hypothetical protein
MKIKDLPEHIRKIAETRYHDYCVKFKFTTNLDADIGWFTWSTTPEGVDVWNRVSEGDYSDFPFPTRHPTKVSDLTEKEVIWCKNKEEAQSICKEMKYTPSEYYKDVCYRPTGTSHARRDFYREQGYTIYPASQFLSVPVKPVEEFKVGDLVEFYREPTDAEWFGIGRVSTPELGRYTVHATHKRSLRLTELGSWYPICCFRQVQPKEEVKQGFTLPGWRRHSSIAGLLEYVTEERENGNYCFSHQIKDKIFTGKTGNSSFKTSLLSLPTPVDIEVLRGLNLWPTPYAPEKKEEKFPEKWYIRLSEPDSSYYPLLYKWRNRNSWVGKGCLNSDKTWIPGAEGSGTFITYEQFCNHYYPGEPMYPAKEEVYSTQKVSELAQYPRKVVDCSPTRPDQFKVLEETGYMPFNRSKDWFVPRWMKDSDRRLEFVVAVHPEGKYEYTASTCGSSQLLPFSNKEPSTNWNFEKLQPITRKDAELLYKLGLPPSIGGKAEDWKSNIAWMTGKDGSLPQGLLEQIPKDKYKKWNYIERLNQYVVGLDPYSIDRLGTGGQLFSVRQGILTEQGLPVLYKPKKVTIFDTNLPEVKPLTIKLLKRKTI